jgi:hypothetical protein
MFCLDTQALHHFALYILNVLKHQTFHSSSVASLVETRRELIIRISIYGEESNRRLRKTAL